MPEEVEHGKYSVGRPLVDGGERGGERVSERCGKGMWIVKSFWLVLGVSEVNVNDNADADVGIISVRGEETSQR